MSELERIVNGTILRDRLRLAALDSDLEWLVPPGTLDGVTQAYGLPVRQVAGIPAPYLAHRFPLPENR